MLDVLHQYSAVNVFWIALSVFLYAMGRGGFPIAPVAMSLLILLFPAGADSSKTAVAFMLPLLIAMDIFGVIVYRRHILWKELLPLVPGTLVGVAIASLLFVSKNNSILYIPDRWFRFSVGVIGLIFVVYQGLKRVITRRMEESPAKPRKSLSLGLGLLAGVFSTLANAGMPPVQMYYLTRKLPKMNMAATIIAFFGCLNVIKLLPFGLLGRLEVSNLVLGVWMLPAIPLGVAAGYGLTRILKELHYTVVIYAALTVTSILLIIPHR